MQSRIALLGALLPALTYAERTRVVYIEYDLKSYRAVVTEVSANVPVDQSLVSGKKYLVQFDGNQRPPRVELTEADIQQLDRLQSRFRKTDGKAPPLYGVPRTSGGFAFGEVVGPLVRVNAQGVATAYGVHTRFQDYVRAGRDSQNDPILDASGRLQADYYAKSLVFARWENTPNGLVPVVDLGNRGSYPFEPYAFPEVRSDTLKQQRFLLDFGKHPDKAEARQLLYPVYVVRYEGENAVIIPPNELQRLERANRGEVVKGIQYLSVPKAILRLAPPGSEGDALLFSTRNQFNEDMREVESGKYELGQLVRANRYGTGGRVDSIAGADLGASLTALNAELERSRHPTAAENDATERLPNASGKPEGDTPASPEEVKDWLARFAEWCRKQNKRPGA